MTLIEAVEARLTCNGDTLAELVAWDLHAEIVHALAEIFMLPESSTDWPFWDQRARNIEKVLLRQLAQP